jgi:hypothetical protein
MRGAPVVLAQQAINVPEAGSVVVQFDGQCWSSPGDRIALAASNTPSWHVNDGTTAVKAYDSDIKIRPFSHSRVYPVSAGTHTFYAVGENYAETGGSGIASVYGCLVVKFFPASSGGALVSHEGITLVSQYLRDTTFVVAQRNITVGVSGNVLVRFDGICESTPGDRIALAASNTGNLIGNDGTTAVEAIDGDHDLTPFCHSRMYSIGPGSHDFYAIAENFVETDGDGIASIYASLTVEFFPAVPGAASVNHTGVSKTNVSVRGAPVAMDSVTITPTMVGTAVVRYEGICSSSPGDRIVLAASHDRDWDSSEGNVAVEAVNSDLDLNNFSHTRVYTIEPGSHTFYAVCENYVETDGSGIASNYASLSVEFFPGYVTGVEEKDKIPMTIGLEQNYPNPFNPVTTICFDITRTARVNLSIYDAAGRHVRALVDEHRSAGRYEETWNGQDEDGRMVASGVYFYRLKADEKTLTRKMVLLK